MNLRKLQLTTGYEDLLRVEVPEDRQIQLDIGRTFPHLPAFTSERQCSLGRVLRAYAACRPDVGYCQGMNFVAGLLVLASDCEEEAFKVMLCLMDNYNLAGFYRASFPLLKRYVIAADHLLLRDSPALHGHLRDQGVQPFLYMHEWLLSVFVDCMPPNLVFDIFDLITQKGLVMLVPVVVSILRSLEGRLLSMQFEEIFTYLKAFKRMDESHETRDGADAADLEHVIDRAGNMELPKDILAYLNEEIDQLVTADPLLGEASGSGWAQAIIRAFSSLSPKKRRARKALGRSSPEGSLPKESLSPKKRPSLAAASPSGKDEAEQSLEESFFSEATEPQSPTKRGRLLSMASRDGSEEVSAAQQKQVCARRRCSKPQQLSFEEEEEKDQGVSSVKDMIRAQCCSTVQQVASPVRRSCRSTSSPMRRGDSGSPAKMSPAKWAGAHARFRR